MNQISSISNRRNPIYSQKDRIRPLVFLNLLLTATLATIAISPILLRNFPYIGNLVIFCFWIISAFLVIGTKVRRSSDMQVAWWLIYIAWLLLMNIFNHSNVSINFHLIRVPIYFVPIMTFLILKYYNYKELLYLARVLFLILIINVISNIFLGVQDPEIFSKLNGNNPGNIDKTTNTGATSFVAICMFAMGICWTIFYNTHKIINKFFSLSLFILMGYYIIFLNTRATTIFLLFIMVLLFIFYYNNTKNNKWFTYILLIIVVLLILSFFLIPFLNFLSDMFSFSDRMGNRLNDLMELTQDGNIDNLDEGSLTARYALHITSLSTFTDSLQSFLIGIGEDLHGFSIYELINSGVGCHSEFFDSLAKYGIVGGFIIIKALSGTINYINNFTVSFKIKNSFRVVMIVFILYSFLNSSFISDIFYVVFMLLPIVILLLDYENKNIYYKKT